MLCPVIISLSFGLLLSAWNGSICPDLLAAPSAAPTNASSGSAGSRGGGVGGSVLSVQLEGCSAAGAAVVALALLAELAERRTGTSGGGAACPSLRFMTGRASPTLLAWHCAGSQHASVLAYGSLGHSCTIPSTIISARHTCTNKSPAGCAGL